LWWHCDLRCSNTLQYTATHCNTLRHTAAHCNTLQCTATHCNTRQHTATHCKHCNTLQHTATHCNSTRKWLAMLQHTATHCNTLQHIATHCNTLQFDETVTGDGLLLTVTCMLLRATCTCQYLVCLCVCVSVCLCLCVMLLRAKSTWLLKSARRVTYEWVTSHMHESQLTRMTHVAYEWVTYDVARTWGASDWMRRHTCDICVRIRICCVECVCVCWTTPNTRTQQKVLLIMLYREERVLFLMRNLRDLYPTHTHIHTYTHMHALRDLSRSRKKTEKEGSTGRALATPRSDSLLFILIHTVILNFHFCPTAHLLEIPLLHTRAQPLPPVPHLDLPLHPRAKRDTKCSKLRSGKVLLGLVSRHKMLYNLKSIPNVWVGLKTAQPTARTSIFVVWVRPCDHVTPVLVFVGFVPLHFLRSAQYKHVCTKWSFAVSWLCLAHHAVRLWRSPRRWPHGATKHVQIR